MSAPIDLTLYEELTEGSATILFPKNKVFYNPVQQYNRDLSCLAIRAFSEMYAEEQTERQNKKRNKQDGEEKPPVSEPTPYLSIMEALSASGLRAVRYAKEVPLSAKVVANDLSADAVKSIEINLSHNNVTDKVTANHADAIAYMAQHREEYHVIDLDPYGTAAPFMDSAIQSIKDGGMMLVTCTDLGVLAGNGYPEKCFSLYGGSNMGGDATHEGALRLVLNMIASTAAKYGMAIEPLLSLSIDFYVRLFVRFRHSPISVKRLASNSMLVYKCSGCFSTAVQPLGRVSVNKHGNNKFGLAAGPPIGPKCAFCGYTNHLGGPMWAGPLQNHEFIDRILALQKTADTVIYKTLPRVEGMLTMARNELDTRLYFKPSSLASVLRMPVPSTDNFTAALGNIGCKASLSHAMPNTIKTDASWTAVWTIMKKIAEDSKMDVNKLSKTSPGYQILTNENIKLDEPLPEDLFKENDVSKGISKLRHIKVKRFQENPTKNWGPKSRPK